MRQGLRAQHVLGRQAPYRLSRKSNELNIVTLISFINSYEFHYVKRIFKATSYLFPCHFVPLRATSFLRSLSEFHLHTRNAGFEVVPSILSESR